MKFFLLLALCALVQGQLFVVSPGDFSPLDFANQPPAAYHADLVDYFINGTTAAYQATIIQNSSANIFYYSDPTYAYFFLENGTFIVLGDITSPDVCYEAVPGSNYSTVASEFGQCLQASIFNFIDLPFAYEYFGLVDLIGLPNAMAIILDPQGYFLSADFSGPYNSTELFDDILQSSYSITERVPIGSTEWSHLPTLPPPC